MVVHIPARRQIGTSAYAAYLRAVDLKNGRVLYPLVGLSSNVALITKFALALSQPLSARYCAVFGVAAGCGVAAPQVLELGLASEEELDELDAAARAHLGDPAHRGRSVAALAGPVKL